MGDKIAQRTATALNARQCGRRVTMSLGLVPGDQSSEANHRHDANYVYRKLYKQAIPFSGEQKISDHG